MGITAPTPAEQVAAPIMTLTNQTQEGLSFSEAESDKKRQTVRKKVLGTKQLQIPLTTAGTTAGTVPSINI